MEKYKHLLNNPITCYVDSPEQFETEMVKLHNQGVDVFVGADTARRVATKKGYSFVQIDTERNSLETALSEARHLLRIEREREEKAGTINAILNCTLEGIIAFDRNKCITNVNDHAVSIIGYNCIGRLISEYIPTVLIDQTLESGAVFTEILIDINKFRVSVNCQPIRIGDDIIGAVVTIQEVDQIQQIEHSVRKKLNQKGHIARYKFDDIVGKSKEIQDVIKKAKRFALSNYPILITGETGTGKEMFAQSIHNYSQRKNAPFVAVNCTAYLVIF